MDYKEASNKTKAIMSESLNISKKNFNNEDIEMNIQADLRTPSEKSPSLKTDLVSAAKNVFNDKPTSNVSLGFKTASEKDITVKPNAINIAKNIALKLQEEEEEEDLNESKKIDVLFNISNIEPKNRLSINATDISINNENFLDTSSFLNSSKLNISINTSKPSHNNRKTFKKPQLIVKSKLNKYLDITGTNNETIADQLEEPIASIHLPIEIDHKEELCKKNSYTLKNESQQNQFFLSGSPNGPILTFKEINIEKSSDGFYTLKPMFELKNIDYR